jgi:branched-chain amino acid transport system permease protein
MSTPAPAPDIAQARPWRGVIPAAVALVVLLAAAQLAPASGYTLNILMQAITYAVAVAGLVVVLG